MEKAMLGNSVVFGKESLWQIVKTMKWMGRENEDNL